jgi:hypothetical protein
MDLRHDVAMLVLSRSIYNDLDLPPPPKEPADV